ncbi:MAG: carboxymuconolactone decarboxylase family protein [Ilumatobacteraceae bacterium]
MTTTTSSVTTTSTTPRLSIPKVAPALYKAQLALDAAVRDSGIDAGMHELIKIRASQINGCAFCLDMHTQDARAIGETDQRMHLLAAWRDTDLYDEREQAALALTEAITVISANHVPDAVWDAAAAVFEPAELAAIVMAVISINGWNRIAISSGSKGGEYRLGQHG